MYGGNIILGGNPRCFKLCFNVSRFFPAESTCVSFGRHSVNCAVVIAQHSVYCARVVRHIRCLFFLDTTK